MFPSPGSTFCGLAFLGRHNVNATWHLGHFFAATLRAFRLRAFVLSHSFDALEGIAALFTAILVGGHSLLHDKSFWRKCDLIPNEGACPLWVISGHRRARSGMSVLPPKADMFSIEIDVGFVPIADIGRYAKHRRICSRATMPCLKA